MNSSKSFNDVLIRGDMVEFIRNNLYLDFEKRHDGSNGYVLDICLKLRNVDVDSESEEENGDIISSIVLTQSDLEYPADMRDLDY